MDSKPRRQNRVLDGPRAVSRNISMPSDLAMIVKEEAEKEGHNNISRVVVHALTEYLNRRYDRRIA